MIYYNRCYVYLILHIFFLNRMRYVYLLFLDEYSISDSYEQVCTSAESRLFVRCTKSIYN
ncbi:hypothetical protein Hanom_Chr12g01126251 [Helianthus anomalus]